MEPLSQVMDVLSLLYTQLALNPFLTRFVLRWFCSRHDVAGGVFAGCREQAVLSTVQLHESSHLRQDLPGRDLVRESPGSAAGGGQLTF